MPSNPECRFFICTGHVVSYSDLHKHADSHILGELLYIRTNDRNVTALARYKKSIGADSVPLLNPDIVEFIVGDVLWIKCGFGGCPRKPNWELGRAGILALMDRLGLQNEYLEMEKRQEQKHEPVA
jgi:hypothetical protein